MTDLGHVVLDKKLHFENLFLFLWPTYATNQNCLNNFGRGLPRD